MMPDALNIQDIVEVTYEKFSDVHDGEVATYIPELGRVDPDDFAICVAAVDGQVFSAGDWNNEFTIQSVCKPFAYQWRLRNWGASAL